MLNPDLFWGEIDLFTHTNTSDISQWKKLWPMEKNWPFPSSCGGEHYFFYRFCWFLWRLMHTGQQKLVEIVIFRSENPKESEKMGPKRLEWQEMGEKCNNWLEVSEKLYFWQIFSPVSIISCICIKKIHELINSGSILISVHLSAQ